MRLLDAIHEQPLLSRFAIRPLRNADECHVAEAQTLELLMDLIDLPQAAIDQQQIWRRNLAILDPRIAPLERLTQRPVVIARRHARDVESPVLLLEWPLRSKNPKRGTPPPAPRVVDVEALDSSRCFGKIELRSERGEHLVHP